jgi:hypothetical protein
METSELQFGKKRRTNSLLSECVKWQVQSLLLQYCYMLFATRDSNSAATNSKSLTWRTCIIHCTVPIWPKVTTRLGHWKKQLDGSLFKSILGSRKQEGHGSRQGAYSSSKTVSINWSTCGINVSVYSLIMWKVTSVYVYYNPECVNILVLRVVREKQMFSDPPITVTARSRAWTVSACSNIGVVGSNLTRHGCLSVFILCLCCSVCSLRPCKGWSCVQGVLQTVHRIRNRKSGQGPTKGCRQCYISASCCAVQIWLLERFVPSMCNVVLYSSNQKQ